MRFHWIALCCLQWAILASAGSLFRGTRRHGTVAEARRAASSLRARVAEDKRQAAAEDAAEDASEDPFSVPSMPTMGTATVTGSALPVPLDAASPESIANVGDYAITMPTPMPAAFNGEYCRGGACQYRVAPPPPLPPTPIPIMPPPLPVGGNPLSGKEFCRGLTCIGGMGVPGSAKAALFVANCVRLYQDVAGGMVGEEHSRTVAQAHQSFVNVCKLRVGPLEVGACPGYANTIMGAEAPKVNAATVGGAPEVCTDTYWFLVAFKQAEIDLKVTKAALPPGYGSAAASSSSLLAKRSQVDSGGNAGSDSDAVNAFFRFGSGGNGPSSPRGLRWRAWVYTHRRNAYANPEKPMQLNGDGSLLQTGAAFVQTEEKQEDAYDPRAPPGAGTTSKPPIPGADLDEDTPRGLPKYTQNPPCGHSDHKVSQKATKYQILPGSPDGVIGPVEVDGDLFNYCANQFSEIMMGFAQTADVTVQMTKDWCAWQASVSSWVGKKDELGHPDWDHRTCSNMQVFMAFVLKDNLADKKSGLGAQEICKKIYLTIGGVHRTESIVDDAWVLQSTRAAPEGSGIPPAGDTGMADLMKSAQEYAQKIFGAMRGQAKAYGELNNAKMDAAAFDANEVAVAPPPPPAPDLPDSADPGAAASFITLNYPQPDPAASDLPDSDDIDPNGPSALIELSVARVRQGAHVFRTMLSGLKPWGQADAGVAP